MPTAEDARLSWLSVVVQVLFVMFLIAVGIVLGNFMETLLG